LIGRPTFILDQPGTQREHTMIRTFAKQLLSVALSFLLVVTAVQWEAGAQQPATEGAAPLSANDLQQLVAPIALYPDALVAQILGAATFPDQIASADVWVEQNKQLTGGALMQAVDSQPWDPSVKALTQFPSVLDNLTKNLSWTSALGEAYHNQAADVMAAVQVLRAQAKAAGNLKSGSQITVVQESPQVIVIAPANPQVVYVPQYNPTVVYGTPYQPPGYSTGDMVAAGVLAFGVGIAVGAAINNSCCGWGYSSWNCNWHSTTVVYRGGSYYGNAAWHGGYYGSSATAYGPNGVARAGNGYNPSTGTYARGASATGAYGSAAAGQAYNPRTGASASTVQGSNAYGSAGASTISKNGETAYTQHQSNAYGTTGSVQTSNGGKAAASSGVNGNYAAGQAANGDKYAAANGNVYKNSGSGWSQTQGTPKNYSSQSASSAESKGWGGQEKSGSSAWGGGGGSSGWQSRSESARGSYSRGGGGYRR
jgi:Protein of unknown function (DUF3300)